MDPVNLNIKINNPVLFDEKLRSMLEPSSYEKVGLKPEKKAIYFYTSLMRSAFSSTTADEFEKAIFSCINQISQNPEKILENLDLIKSFPDGSALSLLITCYKMIALLPEDSNIKEIKLKLFEAIQAKYSSNGRKVTSFEKGAISETIRRDFIAAFAEYQLDPLVENAIKISVFAIPTITMGAIAKWAYNLGMEMAQPAIQPIQPPLPRPSPAIPQQTNDYELISWIPVGALYVFAACLLYKACKVENTTENLPKSGSKGMSHDFASKGMSHDFASKGMSDKSSAKGMSEDSEALSRSLVNISRAAKAKLGTSLSSSSQSSSSKDAERAEAQKWYQHFVPPPQLLFPKPEKQKKGVKPVRAKPLFSRFIDPSNSATNSRALTRVREALKGYKKLKSRTEVFKAGGVRDKIGESESYKELIKEICRIDPRYKKVSKGLVSRNCYTIPKSLNPSVQVKLISLLERERELRRLYTVENIRDLDGITCDTQSDFGDSRPDVDCSRGVGSISKRVTWAQEGKGIDSGVRFTGVKTHEYDPFEDPNTPAAVSTRVPHSILRRREDSLSKTGRPLSSAVSGVESKTLNLEDED